MGIIEKVDNETKFHILVHMKCFLAHRLVFKEISPKLYLHQLARLSKIEKIYFNAYMSDLNNNINGSK